MSNNHSHDNIYSILGKLDALKPTPEEKRFALVKEIRESVEAQGSILTGVDSVQQRLAEQFAKSKIEEKAVSQAQQKFMGMVHAAQKGSKVSSPAVAKVAKDMGKKDARDFAATKHKGLPQHVGEATCNECGMTEGTCEHTMSEGNSSDRKWKPSDDVRSMGMTKDEYFKKNPNSPAAENPYNKATKECCCKELGQKECPVHCDEEPRRGIKEGETTHKDGVTKHRKTDFPGYPSDDLDDSEEDENKGKRGRPRKHAKKKDTGEKRGRGRPSKHSTGEKSSKDNLPFSSKNKMGHDPFGRVKSGAEKTAAKKDSKKSVAESMDNLARRLTEGVNFANLLKEKHQTVDEMLAELSNDMKLFKETGHCSELLRDCMEIKGYHGKMVADEGSEPVQRPSKPDPFAHVKDAPKPPMGIPGNLPAGQIPGKSALLKGQGRNYYEEDSLASELDELAKLAGLSEVSRGEYIKQQDTAAEKSGKNNFNAFGQIFNTDEVNEVDRGDYIKQQDAEAEQAGKDKFNAFGQEFDTDEVNEEDLEEAKIDVADAPESVNKPRPKYASIKTITTQGDDMNREKSQDPATANKAANPFTNKGSRVSEATLSLEAQLAAEYESIKKVN
jgi:hypothetical protein